MKAPKVLKTPEVLKAPEILKTSEKDEKNGKVPLIPNLLESPKLLKSSTDSGIKMTTDVIEVIEDSPLLGEPPKKRRKVKRVIRRIKKVIRPQQIVENGIPNYDKLTEEERTIHRNSFKLKFEMLRKLHPGLNIENGIENNPNLYTVHKVYELYLTHIYKEMNSNTYRGFLLLTFLGLELFGTQVLGLNL